MKLNRNRTLIRTAVENQPCPSCSRLHLVASRLFPRRAHCSWCSAETRASLARVAWRRHVPTVELALTGARERVLVALPAR